MAACEKMENGRVKIGLLGASFDTGNLGVSALCESAIKCILWKWPEAQVVLVASSRDCKEQKIKIGNREITVKKLPVRLSKKIFTANHFFVFVFFGIVLKLLPFASVRKRLVRRSTPVAQFLDLDLICDISGGDSFSDIYGFTRFFFVAIFKWLVIFYGKPLVLLPQTYGPFRGRFCRRGAKHILRHASLIYSRDAAGIDYLSTMLSPADFERKVKFAPDLAFVLDPAKPGELDVEQLLGGRDQDSVTVGMNVSGLLLSNVYAGRVGLNGDGVFASADNYRQLVMDTVRYVLSYDKTQLLLVPHVFTSSGNGEDDSQACRQIYENLEAEHKARAVAVEMRCDHAQMKHIIGMCDLFIGSRMHSCIAALSQGVPAIGIAYSPKFDGVFASAGMQPFVFDLRTCGSEELGKLVASGIEDNHKLAARLSERIPALQSEVLAVFEEINGKTFVRN